MAELRPARNDRICLSHGAESEPLANPQGRIGGALSEGQTQSAVAGDWAGFDGVMGQSPPDPLPACVEISGNVDDEWTREVRVPDRSGDYHDRSGATTTRPR